MLLASAPVTFAAKEASAGKYRAMGEAALADRKYDEAVEYYMQAIQLEPENPGNFYKLFKVHKRMRKIELALEDLNNAVSVSDDGDGKMSNMDEIFRERAKILVSLGQCGNAMQDLNSLMQMGKAGKDDLQLHANVELCTYSIESATKAYMAEEWNEVRRGLDSVIPLTERAFDLLFMRARASYGVEDFYGAVSDTGKILKFESKHMDALQLRGDAYTRLGEHDMALKHYKEALKFDPEHKGCKAGHKFVKTVTKYDKKGTTAFEGSKYEEAIKYWWQAINHDLT